MAIATVIAVLFGLVAANAISLAPTSKKLYNAPQKYDYHKFKKTPALCGNDRDSRDSPRVAICCDDTQRVIEQYLR